jgi:hypothetical protein
VRATGVSGEGTFLSRRTCAIGPKLATADNPSSGRFAATFSFREKG